MLSLSLNKNEDKSQCDSSPFIVMVFPDECSRLEDFDMRKHESYNYYVVVKIFGNGVKIAWNGQNQEGAMCTLHVYVSMLNETCARCREENRP